MMHEYLRRGLSVQPKLEISTPGDRYEQEADAMADNVMLKAGTAGQSQATTGIIGRSIQRKCEACGSSGNGAPLLHGTRNFMESAFGTDFSSVRVHTGALASELSQGIQARAFTYGNDIYFNDGEYRPETRSGQRLLAHELAHTLQQGESAPTIRRESVYESIPDQPRKSTDSAGNTIYTGSVTRQEFRDESDRAKNITPIYTGSVSVRYNESTCQLVVPLSIRFINQVEGASTTCGDVDGNKKDPTKPVSQEQFEWTKKQFLSEVPGQLNGWYSVTLNGDSCSPCKEIPVTVEFSDAGGSVGDHNVIVTGNEGRSYVKGKTLTLCNENDMDIWVHEAGHFALAVGDEYHESDVPRPVERERPGQYSRMAQDAPGGLLEFLERHFEFARSFLQAVYPACSPTLRKTRNQPLELTVQLGTSFLFSNLPTDLAVSLGFQLGIPLVKMRRLSLKLGPNFTYLSNNSQFLAGLRAGFEGRIPLGFAGSLGLEGFGEVGSVITPGSPSADTSPKWGGYAEAGGGLSFRVNNILAAGVEGAGGVLNFGGKTGSNDYFRLGIMLGVSL